LADPPSTPARTQARDAHTRARNLSSETNFIKNGSVVIGKILDNDTYAYVFNAQTDTFGNLVTK
jgi:hypothetical protein